jgi:hypothetical protein
MKPTGGGPQGGADARPDRAFRAASAAPDIGLVPGSFAQRPATAPASNSPNRPAPCAHQRVLRRSTIPPSIGEVPGRDTSLFIGGRHGKGQGVPDTAGDGGVAGVTHRLRHAAGWAFQPAKPTVPNLPCGRTIAMGGRGRPGSHAGSTSVRDLDHLSCVVRAVRNSHCVFPEGGRAVVATGQAFPEKPSGSLYARMVEIGYRILARGQTAAELNLRARLIAL